MKRFQKVFLVFIIPCLILSFLFFGGRSKRSVAPQKLVKFASEPPGSVGYVGNELQSVPGNVAHHSRKIIHNGEITLVVKHYEPFFKALQRQLAQSGGYLAHIEATRNGQEVATATIRFRVPPDKLHLMVSWLGEQGVVASERVTAEDISEQYYDLKARLQNAQRFEERLIQMLRTQTGKLNDVVLVEEKLNQIREQIEQMEGKLRLYDHLVDLATLTLNVRIEQHYVPPHYPTFGERAMMAWRDSTQALRQVAQGTALLAITISPWILPLAAFGFLLRIILLQRIRRLLQML